MHSKVRHISASRTRKLMTAFRLLVPRLGKKKKDSAPQGNQFYNIKYK